MEMYREGKAQHITAAWRTAMQHSTAGAQHNNTEGLGWAEHSSHTEATAEHRSTGSGRKRS